MKSIKRYFMFATLLVAVVCFSSMAHSKSDHQEHKTGQDGHSVGHSHGASGFPYEKVKKHLVNANLVDSEKSIHGYHDLGHGRIFVYASEKTSAYKLIGKKKFSFIRLNREAGKHPKWLFLAEEYNNRELFHE